MVYKLSATLLSHSSDVRAVASPTNELILSASRDTTARTWTRDSNNSFAPASILHPGSRYINSLTYIPPSVHAPHGFVATGGQEAIINVFSLEEPIKDEPVYSLIGHTENVCTLDARPDGTIISGSWDRTARVWQGFKAAYELRGHEQAVWAVLALEGDHWLTGSADKTIKLWDQHKLIHTFTGHKDVVRGLSAVPDIGFASCSNDSEIIVWTIGGDIIYTLSGHTSFVYSLAILPNANIVSAGEDRSVRIWKDGELSQTIVHPAISVWAVCVMPNGDIVSGSSDGAVRVFSDVPERWANEGDLKTYDDEVARQALPSAQVGDVKKSDLPGLEALAQPGRKEGQTIMVRNGDVVEVHQWSSATGAWQKVGDVVDAVGQGRRQLYQGKEYDYVFDVDIQEGAPPLKLPYNVTENPFSAAQRFLQSNDLSLNYIDEVVRFIEQNTGGVKLGPASEEFVDPYTGASRYRPGAGSAPTNQPASYGDSYTRASRDTPAAASAPSQPSTQTYADPFTGASRYVPGGSQPAPPPARPAVPKIVPARTPATFKQANVSAMRTKLLQLNEELVANPTTSALAITPEELQSLDATFTFLTTATGSTKPTQRLAPEPVQTVVKILERWPEAQKFPILDLSRLIAGFAADSYSSPGQGYAFFHSLLVSARWFESWETPLGKLRETNVLLTLRAIANGLQDGFSGNDWIEAILTELVTAPFNHLSKTHRVALATISFNLSSMSIDSKVSPTLQLAHINLATKLLEQEIQDGSETEAAYRCLVSVGNIMYRAKGSLGAAQLDQLKALGRRLAGKFSEQRIQNIVVEISAMN